MRVGEKQAVSLSGGRAFWGGGGSHLMDVPLGPLDDRVGVEADLSGGGLANEIVDTCHVLGAQAKPDGKKGARLSEISR